MIAQSFTLIRWKQAYFLGACIFLIAMSATAWHEAATTDDNWYYLAAAFLALSAVITLVQFIWRIRNIQMFAVTDTGVDIARVGLIPWADIRRIQNFPAHCILFTFVNAPVGARARKRSDGVYEKNCNCRGMNVPVGTALRALRDGYKAHLMRNAASDQSKRLNALFEKEPFFS